ncbi:hypothetical protein HOLleu_11866 [Holothuria leucospilota]|uniref:Uncharacterized protein n=1 Tax=Holothuria leucospilota TaxID=206669 RepID=A0A9Q1CAR7_HOLLE|nr:hypothetical protein HOLleu_11866 [Holothuria leucospilota]
MRCCHTQDHLHPFDRNNIKTSENIRNLSIWCPYEGAFLPLRGLRISFLAVFYDLAAG